MTSTRNRAVLTVCVILLSFSCRGWGKCPTMTAEVHGRVQCSFKPDYKVLVTMIFGKSQIEGSAEETALDIREGSFRGRIGFNTLVSYNPLTGGHKCSRRPISVMVRLITAEGAEWDRKVLRFPNDFTFDENLGEYTLKSALDLKGWCKPNCCGGTDLPNSDDHDAVPK
jgi:hypothetical protein